jgi:hypothetical protein
MSISVCGVHWGLQYSNRRFQGLAAQLNGRFRLRVQVGCLLARICIGADNVDRAASGAPLSTLCTCSDFLLYVGTSLRVPRGVYDRGATHQLIMENSFQTSGAYCALASRNL